MPRSGYAVSVIAIRAATPFERPISISPMPRPVTAARASTSHDRSPQAVQERTVNGQRRRRPHLAFRIGRDVDIRGLR